MKEKSLSSREGCILRLQSDAGASGFGEISPLPGLSPESLVDALNQLSILREKILNHTISPNCPNPFEPLAEYFNPLQLFPSVRFGIESAVAGLWASLRKESFLAFMEPKKKIDALPVIGLLQGSEDEIRQELRHLQLQGFEHFKLKVGGKDPSQEARKVGALTQDLKAGATLRLDSNQSWSLDEAIAFGRDVKKESIVYIEEPFRNGVREFSLWEKFFRETGLSIALDESLFSLEPSDLKKFQGLKAIVLKPTILGGIQRTVEWIHRARELGLQSVISSSFESGVGLSILAQIAAKFDCQPAGLDTYKYLAKDILMPPLSSFSGGRMNVSDYPFSLDQVNFLSSGLSRLNNNL